MNHCMAPHELQINQMVPLTWFWCLTLSQKLHHLIAMVYVITFVHEVPEHTCPVFCLTSTFSLSTCLCILFWIQVFL